MNAQANLNMSLHWFNAWRSDIARAKSLPELAFYYGRAAAVAQANHLMYQALYWGDHA